MSIKLVYPEMADQDTSFCTLALLLLLSCPFLLMSKKGKTKVSSLPCGYTALFKGFSREEGWNHWWLWSATEQNCKGGSIGLCYPSVSLSLFPGIQLFLSAFLHFSACATFLSHSTSPAHTDIILRIARIERWFFPVLFNMDWYGRFLLQDQNLVHWD